MNQEVKEILYNQLQLLAEESAKPNNPEELCQFTSAMCGIADRLFSAPEKYTIQAGSISADCLLPLAEPNHKKGHHHE